jgi:NADH-quinone oxidoreductase subunit H
MNADAVAAHQQQHPNYFDDLIIASRDFLAQPHTLLNKTVWPGFHIPDFILYVVAMLIACGIIIAFISVVAMVMIYLERKIAGHIQQRLGPMRVGWHGILQSVADGIKLLVKEDVVPDNANRFLFSFAPVLVFVGALVPFAALPFAEKLVIANMDAGLFFILSFAALEVIGVIMAGWASNSKWSLYGGMRLAAQMMSYEIPMGLSLLTIVLLAGSLNLNVIVMEQHVLPYVLISPFGLIAFVLFYIAGLASSKRAPFDLPEAESELVSGFHTEYSGMRFSFFFLAEYAAMTLISAVGAIIFLGGWNFPFLGVGRPLLGLTQLGMKTFALLFVMLWLRWTLPRVRVDQIMYMCLKVLLPFGMFCVVGAGIEAVTGQHLLMWVIVAVLATGSLMLARKAERSATPAPSAR